jgi:uncharacterized membrane protein
MTTLWAATLITSAICYLLKVLGYSIPNRILNHPRIQRINILIPVVLLSALVAVQTLSNKKEILIDHRLSGVVAAALALRFKAPFPIMMLIAALVSALVYRF